MGNDSMLELVYEESYSKPFGLMERFENDVRREGVGILERVNSSAAGSEIVAQGPKVFSQLVGYFATKTKEAREHHASAWVCLLQQLARVHMIRSAPLGTASIDAWIRWADENSV